MNPEVRALWARTPVKVWPDEVVLVTLPPAEVARATALVASARPGSFAAVVVAEDEVSVTASRETWEAAGRTESARVDGPYRVLTLDLAIDLDVCGYLLPAAERLADAGISIVPQCAYRMDHLLVRAEHAEQARSILTRFAEECARELRARPFHDETTDRLASE